MVGEAHSDLQAYSVAHRDVEGLAAMVMALQGLRMEGGLAWMGQHSSGAGPASGLRL